ncbi:MAG: hypothetical protein GY943_36135 [Chloroflexi bacterium]|nr:hypothetical protein [Chloroflexota bacterium]
MAKRPFTVSDDEEPIDIMPMADEDLSAGADTLVRKFERKYGARFPRLVAALKAETDENNQ